MGVYISMKYTIAVISHKCIMCGRCYHALPQYFDCDDEGIAFAKMGYPIDLPPPVIQKALKSCPTDAIMIRQDTTKNKTHPK